MNLKTVYTGAFKKRYGNNIQPSNSLNDKSSAHLTVEIAYCHLKKTGKKRSDSGMFYRIEINGDIESKNMILNL